MNFQVEKSHKKYRMHKDWKLSRQISKKKSMKRNDDRSKKERRARREIKYNPRILLQSIAIFHKNCKCIDTYELLYSREH